MIRILLFFILAQLPLLANGQTTQSTEQQLVESIVNYRDFIFLQNKEAPVKLKSLLEKWSQTGASLDEQGRFSFNVNYANKMLGIKYKKIKKRLMKEERYPNFSSTFEESDLEIMTENSNLLELINASILKFSFPFKVNPEMVFIDEIKFYKIKEGDRIGEVGAGTGLISSLIAMTFDKVHLYINELDIVRVDFIEKKFSEVQPLLKTKNIKFINGKKSSTQMEGLLLDKIIIRSSFHHFSKKEEMLTSIKAALKKDGKLYIAEPIPRLDTDNHICSKTMTEIDIKRIFKENGFVLQSEKVLKQRLLLEFTVE